MVNADEAIGIGSKNIQETAAAAALRSFESDRWTIAKQNLTAVCSEQKRVVEPHREPVSVEGVLNVVEIAWGPLGSVGNGPMRSRIKQNTRHGTSVRWEN